MLERQGFDSVSRRAVVSTGRKLVLALRAMVPLRGERAALGDATPPLGATRFLVEAAAEAR